MHCVNAMGDTRWCASKGDALQISPPIRHTSPGGRHTSTELSLRCTNLQMRTVCCQTNLNCTFLSCTNLSFTLLSCTNLSCKNVQMSSMHWQTNLRAAYIRSSCCIAIAPLKGYFARPADAILNAPNTFLFNIKVCKQIIWTFNNRGMGVTL